MPLPPSESRNRSSSSRRLDLLIGFLVACAASVIASRPFWPGQFARYPWMTWMRDDFFYYLIVARNLAAGHGSTFNGLVRTNGYHPLWLLLLTALARVSGGPRAVLSFVALTSVAATVAMYAFALRIFRAAGVRGWVAAALAAYVAICSLDLFFYGMEVTLALPLALGLCVYVLGWKATCGNGWWAGAGLLVALVVLARMDGLLFAALLGLLLLLTPEVRRSLTPTKVASLGAGLLPLAAYFVMSRLVFGLWFPVSGLAKQLRWHHSVAPIIWYSVLDVPRFAKLNLTVAIAGAALLPFVLRRFRPVQRAVLGAMLLFPWVLVLVLSLRSDWEMWPWYYWIFRMALCGSLALWFGTLASFARGEGRRSAANAWRVAPQALAALVSLAAVVRAGTLAWVPGQLDFYQTATEVRAFAATHPGIYAMGDRSGMTAYLLPEPVVQAEGLMMDRGFLDHIRRQDDLRATLRAYGARYYVGTAWEPYTGCFHAVEPIDAGMDSPHMVSDFCEAPLLRRERDGIQTLIFDLGQP